MDGTHIDLTAKYGGTTLSNYEVFMVGESIIGWLSAVHRLGHESPASTLDYATDPRQLGLGGLVVRDFIAWTCGQDWKVPGCEARMREWIERADLDSHAAALVSEVLSGSQSP